MSESPPVATTRAIPTRRLGRTGVDVTILGLGGEGVLRTYGRVDEARAVIRRALDRGVTYFDCARAYAGSEEYYGAALNGARGGIFLTSKAFERTRKGAMQQLEETLRNMRTDHLDLWQMHDVRDLHELDRVSGEHGALEAFRSAREQGKARFLGVTGHYDPGVLTAFLDRFEFDTVLLPVNPCEIGPGGFISTTLQRAVEKGMGIIGMKVPARGNLLRSGAAGAIAPLLRYALSQAVSTAIIGCDTPAQVDENARVAAAFAPMSAEEMRALERECAAHVHAGQFYKKGMH